MKKIILKTVCTFSVMALLVGVCSFTGGGHEDPPFVGFTTTITSVA